MELVTGRPADCAGRLPKEVRCYDCDSPQRICRGMTVLYRPMGGVGETEVVIINEELGY